MADASVPERNAPNGMQVLENALIGMQYQLSQSDYGASIRWFDVPAPSRTFNPVLRLRGTLSHR